MKFELWYLVSDSGIAEKWHKMGQGPDFYQIMNRLSGFMQYESLDSGLNRWQIVQVDDLDCYTIIFNCCYWKEGTKAQKGGKK